MSDFLDDVANIEDQLSRKGFEEGVAHGRAQGERDGYAMGYEHGFAVGSELAYYASFVRMLYETEKLKPGFYSARCLKSLAQLDAKLTKFDNSPKNADLQTQIDDIRDNFKLTSSQAKALAPNQSSDSLSF